MIRIWNDKPIKGSVPATTLRVEGHPRISSLLTPTSELKGWDGYSLYLVGEQVAFPDPSAPVWGFDTGAEQLTVELRSITATLYPARAFAHIWWQPGMPEATRSIDIVHDDVSDKELGAALYALKRLRSLVSRRGKKRGDGQPWPGGRDEFLEDLWDTIARYTAQTGRPWPKITGKADATFRTLMRRCPSERTLRDWLKDAGLRPQDIESGKVTRTNYSQFVAEKRG